MAIRYPLGCVPLAAALLGMVAGTRPAHAGEILCSPVEKHTIQVDGLLEDWEGAEGVAVESEAQIVRGREEWSGPRDLSFEVFCNHDETHLFLAVNVRDEYFVRTGKPLGDDHIVVTFGARSLVVVPGDLRGIKGRLIWGKAGPPRGLRWAEALQRQGYSIELSIPLKLVPGYRPGAPSLPGAVAVHDCDSKAAGKVQTVMSTARSAAAGRFVFAQARAELEGFLRDIRQSAAAIRLRMTADVVGDTRPEQVVLAGRTIGILGEGVPGGAYFYYELPVKEPKDVYWLKLMDLNGDGKQEIVARYIERSSSGRREIIAVFRFNATGGFVRPFAHEVLKGQGSNLLTNRFTFQPRKKRGGRLAGFDIVIDRPEARGFTQETFQEDQVGDAFPILLPWEENKKKAFRFEGEQFFEL